MSRIEVEATHSCDCCQDPIIQERDTDTRHQLEMKVFLKGQVEGTIGEQEWDLCNPCYKRFISYMRRGAPRIDWATNTVLQNESVSGRR